jgi:hypothetical protein
MNTVASSVLANRTGRPAVVGRNHAVSRANLIDFAGTAGWLDLSALHEIASGLNIDRAVQFAALWE